MGLVLVAGGVLYRAIISTLEGPPGKAKQLCAGVAAILYLYNFTYGSSRLTTWYVIALFLNSPTIFSNSIVKLGPPNGNLSSRHAS
jgi:hypothetical protein